MSLIVLFASVFTLCSLSNTMSWSSQINVRMYIIIIGTIVSLVINHPHFMIAINNNYYTEKLKHELLSNRVVGIILTVITTSYTCINLNNTWTDL